MNRKHTPGHKAVLVSEEAFEILKSIQRAQPGEPMALTFDLKDAVSAVILEAATSIPNLRERARQRAFAVMHGLLTSDQSDQPGVYPVNTHPNSQEKSQ